MVQNHPSNGIKVALIGDCGVGKSSILSILQGEAFSGCYVQTKEREIKSHDVVLKKGKGQRLQKLQIWDTPGMDDARTYTAHAIKDVKGVVIVFDVCNENSYLNVQNWIKTLNTYVENASETVVIIIAANKTDKPTRKVKPEQVQQLGHQHNVQCMEVSAKTGEGIKELFAQLANGIAEKAQNQETIQDQVGDENPDVQKKEDNGLISKCVLL